MTAKDSSNRHFLIAKTQASAAAPLELSHEHFAGACARMLKCSNSTPFFVGKGIDVLCSKLRLSFATAIEFVVSSIPMGAITPIVYFMRASVSFWPILEHDCDLMRTH